MNSSVVFQTLRILAALMAGDVKNVITLKHGLLHSIIVIFGLTLTNFLGSASYVKRNVLKYSLCAPSYRSINQTDDITIEARASVTSWCR